MRRSYIIWTDEEFAAVAALTVQLRNTDNEAYNTIPKACREAQKQLLPEDRQRISSSLTNQAQNLGPKFRELCTMFTTKSASQRQVLIEAFLRKNNRTLNVPNPAAIPQPLPKPKVAKKPVQLPLPPAEPVAEPVAEQPQAETPAPNLPASGSLGAALEGALVGAMAPVIDNFLEQMRGEVRSAFERVQQHYTVQLEERLREMLHTELANLAPTGRPVLRMPKHDPSPIDIAPSSGPRRRIIVFHILDSQLAVLREAMRQQLDMHKVNLMAAETKEDLYRKHTRDSFVIYVPKFSNHLPPDYEKKNVKKMLFAKGIDTIKAHIQDILDGKHD